ncbi:MAG: hypothetical protein KAI28_05045, partial [Sphingomonadales bacterium]|nr:hypothetical protein [Sphingomonadales bacterium]
MSDQNGKSKSLTAFLDYAKLPGLKRAAAEDIAPVVDEHGHHLNCVNCGTPLGGPFCSHCGQKDEDIKRPLWSFFSEIGDY